MEWLHWEVDRLPLGLSTRTQNCLHFAGIEHVYQLVEKTEQELLMIRGFGLKSLDEIMYALDGMDLSLEMIVDRAAIKSKIRVRRQLEEVVDVPRRYVYTLGALVLALKREGYFDDLIDVLRKLNEADEAEGFTLSDLSRGAWCIDSHTMKCEPFTGEGL